MATQITIGNRTTSVPGVYASIRSGIINPPSPIDFGNVVIIDDGSLQVPSYIAINGIHGENRQGSESVLEFTEFAQTSRYVWDSPLLPIIRSLYRPSNRQGVSGINKLTIIQAAETTAATSTLSFTNMTTPLILKTQFEGESLNASYIDKTFIPVTTGIGEPTGVTASFNPNIGTVQDGEYFFVVTALNIAGETTASTEVSVDCNTGSDTNTVSITWASVAGAIKYRVYRGVATGIYTDYFEVSTTSFIDNGSGVAAAGTPPSTNGTANATKTVVSNELAQGLAFRLEPGRSFGYSVVFYKGVHNKAEDPLNPGFGFNERKLPDVSTNAPLGTNNIVKPEVLFRSPDLRTLSDLKRWMQKSPDFNRWFKISQFEINDPVNDAIVNADITNTYTDLNPYTLFTGATTTFTPGAFAEAVELTKGLDNTFYLALGSGLQATNTNNTAIYELITSDQLNWEKIMVVAAFDDQSSFIGELNSSQAVARYYNSSKVIAVHGAARVVNPEYPSGFRNISTLEKAAKVLGRIAGLEPQAPVTWKDINISGEVHKLSEAEKEVAISSGILSTFYDTELASFVVLLGINTLQDNEFLVNEDAQSYSIQLERIKSQLNKELIFSAKRTFFGSATTGPNRNTISEDSLLTWTKGFLESKVATNERDNLIVRVGAITTRLDQDNYFVDYEFVPNTEVKAIVFTGIMLSN